VHKVTVDEVEPAVSTSPAEALCRLSEALGAENVAANYFELTPDESFGYDDHPRLDQEEVWVRSAGRVQPSAANYPRPARSCLVKRLIGRRGDNDHPTAAIGRPFRIH
jgi:hypothetical protein